jgi:3',5'-cyclic AMP phosphodiesterase CpdA
VLLFRYFLMLTSRKLIWLAGALLVAVGITCLYLSDQVARPGSWWQGTLDAFGVGFVIGGIIDVLAISIMNQMLSGSQGNRDRNREARNILALSTLRGPNPRAAARFLEEYGGEIDPILRARLQKLADL